MAACQQGVVIFVHLMVLLGLEPRSAPYKEAAFTFRRQNRGGRSEIRTRKGAVPDAF